MGRRALAEHRTYLSDAVRNAAYERAIATVCDGAVVLDLGSGTGIWGLVALRHGAKRVYAVERTGLVDWARAVARRNGAADRITHIRGWSTDVELPEAVDVVVCDQVGPFVLEGDAIAVLADAARRHLRPGGSLIPSRLDYWCALSRSPAVEDALAFWSKPAAGIDLEPFRQMAIGSRWFERPRTERFSAPPVHLGTVVPADFDGTLIELRVEQHLDRPATANALVGWFEAHLAPGVTISNGPPSPVTIDRDAVALPLAPDLSWRAGDRCTIEVAARIGSDVLAWSAAAGGQERRNSTLAGAVAGREDLRAAARHPVE